MTEGSDAMSPQIPAALAFEFFSVFSRFEFALKESGYDRINRFGRVTPDWGGFAESASLVAQPGSPLAESIHLLTHEPPMVQTAVHGWTHTPLRGDTVAAKALDAAQRVRNNLFHGGKHVPHSAPGRDEALVRAALEVLHAARTQNPGVALAYG